MNKFVISNNPSFGWWIGRCIKGYLLHDYLLLDGSLSNRFNNNYSRKLIDSFSILFKNFNVILNDPKKPENQRLLYNYTDLKKQSFIFDEI